ncbi:MAG TPA: phosphate/phosphite/phosphonate ABC transporter substrate-binding protein [Rhodocyclaceae bacterium]
MLALPALAAPYAFGVVPQRSAVLTAQYWNPILNYISTATGIQIELKMARTAPEHAEGIGRGEYDLLYSNHQFKPENDTQGYRVFARPIDASISGQIVVPADSQLQKIEDLAGKEVVFPSQVAFVGFTVPMDGLKRAGIEVKALFAGNQEGAMGQLRAGRAVAAGVNSQVMADYAKREAYGYRVLWASESYLNIPLAAHPRVPAAHVEALRKAFVAMSEDPAGQLVLRTSAALVKQSPPYGFVVASDSEYDNQRRVYRGAVSR